MYKRQLLLFFTIYFASRGQCFENGYSIETCDSLKPIQEEGEPNVTVKSSVSPFEVKTSQKYRINGELEIMLQGKNIEGFQLQVRQANIGRDTSPERVGEFVKWPENTKPLLCDGKNTAVTHINLEKKEDLKFTWRAPDEDSGVLRVYDAYVAQDGTYVANVSEVEFDVADLPLSVRDCGQNKSCVRYSKTECNGMTCPYLLTYQIEDNDMEFTLNSLSEAANSYSAVGFRETEDGPVDLIACIRENTDEYTGVSVKRFVIESEGGQPIEKTVNIQDVKFDQEKNNSWCAFTRPVKDSGAGALDLNEELFWIYAWGKTNKTTNLPIRGNDWHQVKHNIEKLINEKSYDSSHTSVSCFMLVSLSSFLLFVSQMKRN